MGVYDPQAGKNRRMYSHVISGISEDIKIMGYPFHAEDIQGREPYNRRERKWTPILNGTEEVTNGEYVHREYSFSSIISFPPGKPEIYDTIFRKMMSEPVEVISKVMGGGKKDGRFKAMITMSKSFPYPNRMKVDVTVTEVPGKKSLIPGELSMTVPSTKKIETKDKITTKLKSSKTSKTIKNTSKRNKFIRKSKSKTRG